MRSPVAFNFEFAGYARNWNPGRFREKAPSEGVFVQAPQITGEVDLIEYKQFIADKLYPHGSESFDINKTAGAFLFEKSSKRIAVSRWISPKRSRSYPFERVYDTLAFPGKKVAVIPVVKDEGAGGERDFLQWDTISLLSLLDVHVVLAFYTDAEKARRSSEKITNQKFDNEFIKAKLDEIINFPGTPRAWNELETRNLQTVFGKAKTAYREISKKTGVRLHDEQKLDELIKYAETPQRFIGYSRRNAQNAQEREFLTVQPKEALASASKGKITITNALYGKYFFTVDETLETPGEVFLTEAKHTSRALLPSRNDIKDGLIKMMLYTNLINVKSGSKNLSAKPSIRLTSARLTGKTDSNAASAAADKFFAENLLNSEQKDFLRKLFKEARANNFTVILERGETGKP